jgi:hypothetical protein
MMIAVSDPECAAALARFPLSRVSEAFHDEMLGVLPPVHIRGAAGLLRQRSRDRRCPRAVRRACNGRFYGAYVALRDPATWITHAAIAAFDAAHPVPPVLDWYPGDAEDR